MEALIWYVAWRRQAIIWTNVDKSSAMSCDIQLRTFSQEMLKISTLDIHLKMTTLILQPYHPEAQGLIINGWFMNAGLLFTKR